MHQISLSQRATKNEMEFVKKGMETKIDGLNKGVEAKMNGLEAKMDGMEVGMEAKIDDMEAKIDENMKDNMENMKNDLKAYMEGLMTSLKPEMIPNGGNIGEEPHDENKINVNRDFINSNVGFRTEREIWFFGFRTTTKSTQNEVCTIAIQHGNRGSIYTDFEGGRTTILALFLVMSVQHLRLYFMLIFSICIWHKNRGGVLHDFRDKYIYEVAVIFCCVLSVSL